MVMNKKVTGKASLMPIGLSAGVLVGVSVTLLGAAVAAYMVLTEVIAENAIGYACGVILFMASALAAMIAAAMIKRRWMLVCLVAGGIYYLVLLSITALFFGGQYQGMGVTLLLILAGSGAVGLLGLRSGKRTVNRRKKYVHR